jgi:DNA-binding transcriptional MerR regulator
MRSQDVARLAGVSVRTLRHYHQIGVLPEPVRQSNGYRSYDLATVARLLRIRLLTELGVPLGKVEEMLDTTPRQDLLDEIDSRLASEIERLDERRRQIARLRRTGQRADVPEDLAELLSLGSLEWAGGVLGELDQDTLLVLARVLGPEPLSRQALSDLADALGPLKDDAELVAASEQFEHLADDAPPTEVDQVATRMAAALEPVMGWLARSPTGRALAGSCPGRWPDPSQDSRLSPAQRRAMSTLFTLLVGDEPR